MRNKPLPPPPAFFYGEVQITIDRLMKKYFSVMPEDMFFNLSKRQLNGENKIRFSQFYIEKLDERLAIIKAEKKKLNQCAARNAKGKEYEKAGKIKQAITTYEKNIEGDCYPACHSFDRLMIIYRKLKDYENEVRVIERAFDVLCPRYPDLRVKYQERLSKAKDLQLKAK